MMVVSSVVLMADQTVASMDLMKAVMMAVQMAGQLVER